MGLVLIYDLRVYVVVFVRVVFALFFFIFFWVG